MRPSRLYGIGRQSGIPEGLPDEEFRSGWANVQSNNYWSSTTNANNTNNAWNVNMWNGNVNNNNKDNNNYVWPVRSGEWESQKISPCPSLTPPLKKVMTRGGDAGEFLFSFKNLYRSYLKCRRNKRNTINALKFEINAEENLFNLSEELTNKTYQPSRSICFIVERPKMREIIAADFRDRVVHHLLVERLEAIYESVFIHDSYACRKNKGLHKAIERVRDFIRKCSSNGRKKIYFLHLDIRNFFMTIDREILFQMLKKKLTGRDNYKAYTVIPGLTRNPEVDLDSRLCGNDNENNLLWLAHTIIFHNPVDNCIIKGEKELVKHLPPHKSLFHAPENKGLPIGNLTSQFFANVYLNELDQYAKHTLKCRYYVRYCDDFVIINESLERLAEIKERIGCFVNERLALSLNDKFKGVMPVSNGIDFLGYIIKQDYTLVRRRAVNNLRTKLNWFEKRLVAERENIEKCHSRENGNPVSSCHSCGSRNHLLSVSFRLVRNPSCLSGIVKTDSGQARMTGQVRNDVKKQQELFAGQNVINIIRYDYPLIDKLRSVFASYLGHLKWAETYNLRQAIIGRYGFLKEYFCFKNPPSPFLKGGDFPLYQEGIKECVFLLFFNYKKQFSSVRTQYLYYANKFKYAVVFFQVGCFYEFYAETEAANILNLKRLSQSNRGMMYGFHARQEGRFLKMLAGKNIPVIIIRETDRYIGRLKERLPVMKINAGFPVYWE